MINSRFSSDETRYVPILSTIYDATTKEVKVRDKIKHKSQVCLDDNDTMSGVDLSDAYLSSYPSARKQLKNIIKKNDSITSWIWLNSIPTPYTNK